MGGSADGGCGDDGGRQGHGVYNGDGTFTYTATAGQEGLDTFQYTITDRDGDTSTATVTVDLGTDFVPSLVGRRPT